jgi:amidase
MRSPSRVGAHLHVGITLPKTELEPNGIVTTVKLSSPALDSATSMVIQLGSGEIGARELVDAHLDRIAAVNDAINALVQVAGERALAEAEAIDSRRAHRKGDRGVEGLPFTVKDNFETAGIPTAIGVVERKAVVPERDAALVEHVRALGAVLLGKTNCPPWGGGLFTENDLYGRTNNPYDLTRTPGGSSGGEAAAVAGSRHVPAWVRN